MRISDWSSDVCSSDLLSILTSDASIRSSSDDSPLPMTSDRLSSSGAHGSWMSLSHRFTNQGFCELWTTKSTVISAYSRVRLVLISQQRGPCPTFSDFWAINLSSPVSD